MVFLGKLGNWKTYPVYLKLKEDVELICSITYPEMKVNEGTFKKEVNV